MDTDLVGNCFSLTVTASEGKIQMTNTNTNDNCHGNDKYLLESPRKDGGEAGVGEREGVEVGQSRQVARAQRGHRRRGEVEVLQQIRKKYFIKYDCKKSGCRVTNNKSANTYATYQQTAHA